MRLIQAKVSEEQFKAFSHYCVECDLTVAGAISGWIDAACVPENKRVDVSKPIVRVAQEAEQEATKSGINPEVGGKVTGSSPVTHSKKIMVSGLPLEPEFVCKACGKPTEGDFLCNSCKK